MAMFLAAEGQSSIQRAEGHGGGLAELPGFINAIGGLYPMPPAAHPRCSICAKPPTFPARPRGLGIDGRSDIPLGRGRCFAQLLSNVSTHTRRDS